MYKLGISAGCIALLSIASVASAGQILDPNFTSGFSSDYTQVLVPDPAGPGGQWGEGTWAITTNPQLEHGLWYSFNTPGGGNMMTVNGATDAGERVWYETVAPGTYDFSALVANSYPDSPADLVLELNGNQVSSIFQPINPPGTWTDWSASFTSDGYETLAIVDLNTEASGNDFALTQASDPRGVPDGGMTSVMLGMGVLGLGGVRRMLKK